MQGFSERRLRPIRQPDMQLRTRNPAPSRWTHGKRTGRPADRTCSEESGARRWLGTRKAARRRRASATPGGRAGTEPAWAPDLMSIWPVEDGRCGIDAHYRGATGTARAKSQHQRLQRMGLHSGVSTDDDGTLLRLGPLPQAAILIALAALVA